MDKVRYEKYVKVCERLEQMGKTLDRMSLLMDIESADKVFELRLDDWLAADDFNFLHDIYDIMYNIVRERFPATDFGLFVPRFAAQKSLN